MVSATANVLMASRPCTDWLRAAQIYRSLCLMGTGGSALHIGLIVSYLLCILLAGSQEGGSQPDGGQEGAYKTLFC